MKKQISITTNLRGCRRDEDSISSSSSSTSSILDLPLKRSTSTTPTNVTLTQAKKNREARYPTHNSFIVDMNNKPLYECDKLPKVSRHTQTEVVSKSFNIQNLTTEEAPGPRSLVREDVYYPPKSPFGRKTLQRQQRKCPNLCYKKRFQAAIFILIIIVVVTILHLSFGY